MALNVLSLLRGLLGAALPVAVFGVWRLRKSQIDTSTDDPEGEEEEEAPPLYRPSRSELREIIRSDEAISLLDISGMRLRGLELSGRSLDQVDATRANLQGADLGGATLSDVNLNFADLTRADLREAAFHQTSLVDTLLWGADLRGADLSGSRNLMMASLGKAVVDHTTRWPPGFDIQRAGAIVVKPRST